MTTFWPKRDEDGRHVTDDKGQRVIIGECGGPIANFKPSCEHDPIETLKPLSELLAKLDPDVVERARADVAAEVESGKLSYDCIYCCDTGISIDEYGEEITCECTE